MVVPGFSNLALLIFCHRYGDCPITLPSVVIIPHVRCVDEIGDHSIDRQRTGQIRSA